MDKGLEYAQNLMRYISTHHDTPRAFILFNHLVQLAYLAGIGVSSVPAGLLEEGFVSLHDYTTDDFVKKARERMNKGLVSENWDEILESVFREKGASFQKLSY